MATTGKPVDEAVGFGFPGFANNDQGDFVAGASPQKIREGIALDSELSPLHSLFHHERAELADFVGGEPGCAISRAPRSTRTPLAGRRVLG